MRVLLTEPRPGVSDDVARTLATAGHSVERCSDRAGEALPCRLLHGEVCPLDDALALDVAVAVRARGHQSVGTGDWGAVCALRAGVPLVVVDAGRDDPFGERATVRTTAADVVAALDDAAGRRLAGHERAAGAEVRRLLDLAGIAGPSHIEVHRRGRDLRAVATLPEGTDKATRERIGVHLAGVLAKADRWSRRIDISARCDRPLDRSA